MLDLDLEQLFREYWEGSYPNAPANKQAAASHVAFGAFVIEEFRKAVSKEWAKKPSYESEANEG